MTLSPSERERILALTAAQIAADLRAGLDLDELSTLPIDTAAQLLGVPVAQAARALPIIEVGPRTRRVTVRDFKAYLASRTRQPIAAP